MIGLEEDQQTLQGNELPQERPIQILQVRRDYALQAREERPSILAEEASAEFRSS